MDSCRRSCSRKSGRNLVFWCRKHQVQHVDVISVGPPEDGVYPCIESGTLHTDPTFRYIIHTCICLWVSTTARMMGDVPCVAGFAKPLWEEVRLGGVWAYHSAALLTGSGAGSVATFLQQMFDRENIFTAGEGREGKYMFYDTSQLRWRKRRGAKKKNPPCAVYSTVHQRIHCPQG